MVATLDKKDMLDIKPGHVALVKSDDWFYGADGREYHAAYGPCYILRAEDLMGFKPKNSGDWFVQVGSGEKSVLLAGCRVHYVGLFPDIPKNNNIYDAR